MIEPKTVQIDEREFIIKPFTGLMAVKLDRRILRIITPALNSLSGFTGNLENMDFGTVGTAIAECLDSFGTDDEYQAFIRDILSQTMVVMDGTPHPVYSMFDAVFQGEVLLLYKLLFENLKHNKFSFLALAGGGKGILQTLTSSGQRKK